MHFQYRKNHPLEQTTALLVGSAVHKMVLEPETFDSEFVIAPDINRRTKNGKEEYADFLKSAAGKSIITKKFTAKLLTWRKQSATIQQHGNC